jgi:hypothetical protein
MANIMQTIELAQSMHLLRDISDYRALGRELRDMSAGVSSLVILAMKPLGFSMFGARIPIQPIP